MTDKEIENFKVKIKFSSITRKEFCKTNNLDYSMFIQRLNYFKKMDEKTEKAINKFMGK